MHLAGPLDVVAALDAERTLFLELLASLDPADWSRPTECPAYDVQGVAAHLLGDDLSLLSRQRDSALPGLIRFLQDGTDFRDALDQFNDAWVTTAQFFSPAVLTDLLALTGRWTVDWYAGVDPESLGEPVGFFGATGPSPYWQIAAREYVERWVHHHQIRRALGREDAGDDAILRPAAAVVMRGFAAHLHDLGANDGTTVVLSIDDLDAWTLRWDTDHWVLFEGRDGSSTAEVAIPRHAATPALSRGLAADAIAALLVLSGDVSLAEPAAAGLAALAGR